MVIPDFDMAACIVCVCGLLSVTDCYLLFPLYRLATADNYEHQLTIPRNYKISCSKECDIKDLVMVLL